MTKAATTAGVTPHMAMGRTRTVGVGVGEMAGAIVPTSTAAMRGKDTTAVTVITQSSTTVAAVGMRAAAASTVAASVEAMVVVAVEATVAAVAVIVEILR